jgi:peptidyl-prolyl cis-trans isomerase A (cyclophilin A)
MLSKSLVCALLLIMSTTLFAATKNPIVKLQTSMGDVFVEVYSDKAPISAQNFLEYVQEGFYDGTLFHRVIPNFMVQGGGFLPGLQQKKTKSPIKNEAKNGLKNLRGTLAMARTSVVDSATSQFFINHVDNGFLDFKNENSAEYGYAVFGKVIDGMDVVDTIAKTKTHFVGYYGDVPVEDVVIIKATLIRKQGEKQSTEVPVASKEKAN